MLAQINGYPLHHPILTTLLKSLVPFISKNQEWSKQISQLSKVKNLFLIIQNKLSKVKEGESKCPICQKFIFQGNLFVMMLHMEVEHESIPSKRYLLIPEYENELVVKKYELTYDGLQIHLVKRSSISAEQSKKEGSKKTQKLLNQLNQNQYSFKDYVVETSQITYLQSSHKSRCLSLLERIFSKFSRRIQTISTERKHYHSYNVFREIGPESEHSDDEREQLVEIELERLRINDFSDVSYYDKLLYLQWNTLFRKQKKELKIIDNIVPVVEKFILLCKQKQIPKININMHLYTLWSVGRLTAEDMWALNVYYEVTNVTDQKAGETTEKMDKE